jgi:hypothetical protein
MQIGLNRIVEGENHDREDGATEPPKVGVQKSQRLRQAFGRKLILLVRQVDLWLVGRRINRRATARTANINLGSLASCMIALHWSVRQRTERHKVSALVRAPVVRAPADSPGNHSVQIAKANELGTPGLSPCVLE